MIYRILTESQYGRKVVYSSEASYDVFSDATMTEGVNQAGALTFTVPPDYQRMRSLGGETILLEDDNGIIWRGWCTSVEKQTDGSTVYTCEGMLAWLNNVVVTPRTWTNESPWTILRDIMLIYNSDAPEWRKVHFRSDSDADETKITYALESPQSVFRCLSDLLSQTGFFVLSHYDDARISLRADPDGDNTQSVEFGENLIDYDIYESIDDMITCVYAVGDGELTTTYIGSRASEYGKIWGIYTNKDLYEETALKNAARDYLIRHQLGKYSVSASAVDMSYIDSDKSPFAIGKYTRIITPSATENLIASSRTFYPLNPAETTVNFGSSRDTLTTLLR